MRGNVVPVPSDHVPHRARALLGDRTGIVVSLLSYLPDRTDPSLFYTAAVETDVEVVSGRATRPLDAGGAGLRFGDSVMSTLGEAMERYSLSFPAEEDFVSASHRELVRAGRNVVDFEFVSVFDPDHLRRAGLEGLTRDTEIRWQPARDLLTGGEVLVPAELVWMGLDWEDDRRHLPTTSNGCACGESPAMAVTAALSECVERDAIMRAWYTGGGTRAVSPTGRPQLEAIAERLETPAVDMHWFEVESTIDVPTVCCAAVDARERMPALALGGASALDWTRAFEGAGVEAAQTMAYLKELVAEGNRARDVDTDRIFDLEANLLYYARPENVAEVESLLDDGGIAEPAVNESTAEGFGSRLRSYRDECKAAGITPLVVDLTPRDVRELGYTVVRVFVPELVDLSLPSLPPVKHPALDGRVDTLRPHPYP